ncbi:uncharacterized protein LOC135819075 [Sycon ciliatum]|uniref:uncharacterized protein LOC135819075 n=1 Tax=Sycon ciliatum TaxID=27933 RepID=UPI0031F6D004
MTAITTTNVTGSLRPIDWNDAAARYTHLQDIKFPKPADPRVVDILIGLDHAEFHTALEEVQGEQREPIARRTALGRTCVGIVDKSARATLFCHHSDVFVAETSHDSLEGLVRQMWEMDSPREAMQSTEDCEIICSARATLSGVGTGRYTAGLSWKRKPAMRNSSYDMALKRLRSTERRLRKEPDVAKEYQRVLQRHLECGYVSEVENIDGRPEGWILPHHPITRPDATTTKVRVVFDASATAGELCLNDCLHAGPKLQRSLQQILLRFRRKAVALVADVAEMYLQIELRPEDKPYHRFLWRDLDTDKEPSVYQYNRVVFGVNASPFLAQFVSQEHARQHAVEYPMAAETILESTYMDDSMDSVEDEDQAVELYHQLSKLWKLAGMHARKWVSNSSKLLAVIPAEDRAKQVDLSSGTLPTTKTLGVLWRADDDAFTFKCKPPPSAACVTKRQFLRNMATLFDPLGFVTPFIMSARVLFQDVWIAGTDWDEHLAEDVQLRAQQWYSGLAALEAVEVPQCLVLQKAEAVTSTELHVFGDASQVAYGAVAYLRVTYQCGEVSSRLVWSKGKVAPLGSVSIPRLELSAGAMACRLGMSIAKVLSIPREKVVLWTDSMNVLCWVRNRSRLFKPYVANRVSEIQQQTEPSQWRYVPTAVNPADLISRGTSAESLVSSVLWWDGPEFLSKSSEEWPSQPTSVKSAAATMEIRSAARQLTGGDSLGGVDSFFIFHKKTAIGDSIRRVSRPGNALSASQRWW